MLNVSHISKTFFKGTINEKKALNDLSLTLILVTSLPLISIVPESGRYAPAIEFRSVLLPAPLPPITVQKSPSLSVRERSFNDGDFCTVIGGNGAGKSTLLNSIAGAYLPDSGTIEINGKISLK